MATPESESHARWWPSAHGFAPGSGDSYFVELHSLLLGLAGRLPDGDLVELRGAVVDQVVAVPGAVVTAAIDAGVPLTRPEVNTIVEVARGLRVPGGESKRLDELTLTDTVTDGGHRFVARPDVGQDYADQAVAGRLASKRGVTRAWRAWREDGAGPRRVFLAEVVPGTEAWWLTVTIQQRLTELVTRGALEADTVVPTVEMFWQGQDLPPYHRAALAAAELLWSREGAS